jgi:hypothetical protein
VGAGGEHARARRRREACGTTVGKEGERKKKKKKNILGIFLFIVCFYRH